MRRLVVSGAVFGAIGTVVFGAESAPPQARDLNASIASTPAPSPVVPGANGGCPDNMVLVEGDHWAYVAHGCMKYVDGQVQRDRCEEYVKSSQAAGKRTPLRFCIDRYEFPNLKGVKPITAVNWDEAAAGCARVGKRLCKDKEWTLACEGAERLPYPYGYTRSAKACNIDRPYILPDNEKLNDPYERAIEMERLDRREPSGSREQCVSPYGVYDMTGNVDEWVVNEDGKVMDKPYRSGLKGGWWGPVRNRCRPMTTDHNQWHQGFAIGYRCCTDAR